MFRNVFVSALVALGLVTWGASKSFALTDPQPQSGLMISQVLHLSTAAQQGLEAGDVIVAVNGVPIRSLSDLERCLRRSGQVALLDVIDCNTGLTNRVRVFPTNGQIGVLVVPVVPGGVAPVYPLPLPIQPWRRGMRPLPLPVPPRQRGVRPIPLPLPVNPRQPQIPPRPGRFPRR
jgi:hypothetical protein